MIRFVVIWFYLIYLFNLKRLIKITRKSLLNQQKQLKKLHESNLLGFYIEKPFDDINFENKRVNSFWIFEYHKKNKKNIFGIL